MDDLKFEFLPAEYLARPENSVDADRLPKDASEVEAAGMLEDLGDDIETPNLRAQSLGEMGNPVDVVVMHVAGYDDID
jgi:hypothetical protein